jgi:hypothetical protein
MTPVRYEEKEETVVLKTDVRTEWLESDAVVCPADWA